MDELLDIMCAEALNVSVEEYIRVIESISYYKANVIIGAIMSDEPEKIEKAKKIFKNMCSIKIKKTE